MDNQQTSDNGNALSQTASLPAGDGAAGAAAQHGSESVNAPPTLPLSAPPPYHPDGLDGGLVGATDRETIDRLSAALKDWQAKGQAGQAPEPLEAYGDFSATNLPDSIKAHMEGLGNDPLFKSATIAAQKHGVSKAAMQEIVASVYESAAEGGLLEPPLDVEKERLALLPQGYESLPKATQDSAIDARLQANVDYLQLMIKNGQLERAVAEHAAGMLMDTAAGNQFLEAVRHLASGGARSQPFGGGGQNGQDNGAGRLREELARVEAKRGTMEWDPKEHEAIMARYRNLYGE